MGESTPKRSAGILKQILPTEHGSWAFVLEPLLVALIGSRGDLRHIALPFASFLGFLAFRPAKLAWGDLKKRKTYPRTRPALAVTALCAVAIALCGWAEVPYLLGDLPYLALAAALAIAFVVVDLRAKPRSLARELVGAAFPLPLAVAAFPISLPLGVLLTAMLASRSWAAVLSIRAIFKRTPDWRACQVASLFAVFATAAFWIGIRSFAPLYVPAMVRGLWLVATPDRPREAKVVGIHESQVSFACVLQWAAMRLL